MSTVWGIGPQPPLSNLKVTREESVNNDINYAVSIDDIHISNDLYNSINKTLYNIIGSIDDTIDIIYDINRLN